MIAVDTSSLRRYLDGSEGDDVDLVEGAIAARQAVLPPVVLTEILSDPRLPATVVDVLSAIPLLPLADGYWKRAAALRSKLLESGQKAKIADALIAQSCIDHKVRLITHDRDFRHYQTLGLALA